MTRALAALLACAAAACASSSEPRAANVDAVPLAPAPTTRSEGGRGAEVTGTGATEHPDDDGLGTRSNVRRSGVPDPPGDRLPGVRRPPISLTDIDYEALPVLRKTEEETAPRLTLKSDALTLHGDLLAAVEIGSFEAATDSPFATSNAPRCGAGYEGAIIARWSGFEAKTWRDERLRVVSAEGLFDKATCEASARRAGRADAKAVVPGWVYAYRELAADDLMPGESVVVILPPADGVSLTMSPDATPEALRTGAYTRVRLPLSRGSGSGFVARITPSSIDAWQRLRTTRRPLEAPVPPSAEIPLLVGVDVTWEGDQKSASLTVAVPEGADGKRYAAILQAAKLNR